MSSELTHAQLMHIELSHKNSTLLLNLPHTPASLHFLALIVVPLRPNVSRIPIITNTKSASPYPKDRAALPHQSTYPLTLTSSLTPKGTPSSTPKAPPSLHLFVDASAAFLTSSTLLSTQAVECADLPSTSLRMSGSIPSTTSLGVTFPLLYASWKSATVRKPPASAPLAGRRRFATSV